MSTPDLKQIASEAKRLLEAQEDISLQLKALGEIVDQQHDGDWAQFKALIKAQILDERDGSDGKRVRKIIEKAAMATAYAEVLGLAGSEGL